MKKQLLIYGAGAIGRGYLPWVFTPDKYEYTFIEKNPKILALLKKQKSYTTYMSLKGQYKQLTVPIKDAYDSGEGLDHDQYSAILVSVGPRNFMGLRDLFRSTRTPIICFENDDSLPLLMRKATGNDRIYFAIPDVITSNTAPEHLLKKDPLSIVTENGVCFIDKAAKSVGGDCHYISTTELRRQWLAKLFLHNTPHCVTAYFGSLLGSSYLHEAMQNRRAASVIRGIMREMEKMLEVTYRLDKKFLRFYSTKELRRFSNVLLFDPISRVAREPFRKLAPNERLIGAAQLCLSSGIIPKNLIIGIMAAFMFENERDPDYHIRHLVKALQRQDFLRLIIHLRTGEALSNLLEQNWDDNIKLINRIKNEK